MSGHRTFPWHSLLLAAVAALGPCAAVAQDAPDPPQRAMRLGYIDGPVSLAPAGTDAWVADLLNRPLAPGDRLWAEPQARAELELGSSAVRLGGATALELLNLDDRALQLKLSTGTLGVRVRALAPGQTVEIDTPLAALSVLTAGEFRIDVDEASGTVRVVALSGQIAAVAGTDAAALRGGEQATYTDQGLGDAEVGALPPGDAFDQWVSERDRRQERAVAAQYVSRDTTGYEDLDEYGSWQTVETYGPVWVPLVAVSWAPYRAGYWAWVAPWGWSWVDSAPWGFAPFHYGRWIYLDHHWCWAPGPRHLPPVYAPALVAWVGAPGGVALAATAGPSVAWFALGWNEVYLPAYRASPRYLRQVNVTNLHANAEFVNSYLASSADGRGPPSGVPFRNQAVPGAVTATTRGAFAAAMPVDRHPADLPREAFARLPAANTPPAVVPSLASVGQRAAAAPSAAPDVWQRTVVARAAPPPSPPSFEQQRRAIAANGGTAPAGRIVGAPRSDFVRSAAPRAPTAPRAVAGNAPPRTVVRGAPTPAPAPANTAPQRTAPAERPAVREETRDAPARAGVHPPPRAAEPHGRVEPKRDR